jgi:hypothetical protein
MAVVPGQRGLDPQHLRLDGTALKMWLP